MEAQMQWQRQAQRRAPASQGSVMSSEGSTFLDVPFDSVEHDSADRRLGTEPIPQSGMCFWVMSGEVQLSVIKRGMSKRDKAMNWLGRERERGGHNASQSLWDDEAVQPAASSQQQAVTKCVGTVLHGQPLCGFSSGLSGALEACTATASSGAEVFCIEAAVLLTLPDPWSEKVRTAWRRVEVYRARQIGTSRHERGDGEEESQMSTHKPSKKDRGPWTIMKSQWLKRKIFGGETSQRVSWLSKAHKQISPKYTPSGWTKGAQKQQGDESRNLSTSSWKASHSLWSSDGGQSSQVYASRLLDICLGDDEQQEEPGRPQPNRQRSQKARRRLLTSQDVRPGSGPFFQRPISTAGQTSAAHAFVTAVAETPDGRAEKDQKSKKQPSARFT